LMCSALPVAPDASASLSAAIDCLLLGAAAGYCY
jgi:hypothetical protein